MTNGLGEELFRLYSYKMTDDTGFAPNPYHGIMTLATCKPEIRRVKDKGVWIAGFSSIKLNRDPVGKERLVYLMRVDDKLSLNEYYYHPDFATKRPEPYSKDPAKRAGDNIYRPLVEGAKMPLEFEQVKNPSHWDKLDKQSCSSCGNPGSLAFTDINGEYVLISHEFYYFGSGCIATRPEVRPSVPSGPAAHGWETTGKAAESFIAYVRAQYSVMGEPHDTPDILG